MGSATPSPLWLLALSCVLGGAGAYDPASPLTSGAITTNASEANTTLLQPNATLDDATAVEDEALLRQCELWIPAAYVHQAALPMWFVLVITWSLYCLRHQNSVKDLHKLLTWAPCVELLVLPIPLMPKAIEAALRAGKHVLSEKPAAPVEAATG